MSLKLNPAVVPANRHQAVQVANEKFGSKALENFKSAQTPSLIGFGLKSTPIEFSKSDKLGYVEFSDLVERATDPKAPVANTITTGKNPLTGEHFIKFFSDSQKCILGAKHPMAKVTLSPKVNPDSVQVGFQDNKGGFALKIWDSKSNTSFVLPQFEKKDALLKIPGFINAEVEASKTIIPKLGITFTGNKTSLDEDIEKSLVIGMFGGFGTRLLAVSSPKTKPMTQLGENSFEVNMLNEVANAGFKNVAASLYFQPDKAKEDISGAMQKGHLAPNLNVEYTLQNDQTGNLGTGGAVRLSAEFMAADIIADKLHTVPDDSKAVAVLEEEFVQKPDLFQKIKVALPSQEGTTVEDKFRNLIHADPALRAEIFEDKIKDVPFVLVVSGDHVTNVNLRELAQTHKDSGAAMTIALRELHEDEHVGDKSPYGQAIVDEQGKIKGFKEKPAWSEVNDENKWVNTGIYVLSPQAMLDIPSELEIKALKEELGMSSKDEGFDIGKNLIPKIVETEPIQGYQFSKEHWADVGNNNALMNEVDFIVDDIKSHHGKTAFLPGQEFQLLGNAAIAKGSQASNVKVMGQQSHVLVGSHAHVGNIKASGSVYIGPDSTIPNGSTLKNVWVSHTDEPIKKDCLLELQG